MGSPLTATLEPATTTATPILQMQDIGFTTTTDAGPLTILHAISLTIQRGERVAVLGPSGSGKSTLMTLMAGLERPSAGTITVDGITLNALSEDRLAVFRRQRIGIVFQAFHLIPTLTALENTAVPLELAGQKNAHLRAKETLTMMGLEHRLHHIPSRLSGGEQQRVALARALASGAKLLLADEPTGNLDTETGRTVADLLFAACKDHGASLVLITHDEDLAAQCDRIIRLHDGEIVSDNTTARTIA